MSRAAFVMVVVAGLILFTRWLREETGVPIRVEVER